MRSDNLCAAALAPVILPILPAIQASPSRLMSRTCCMLLTTPLAYRLASTVAISSSVKNRKNEARGPHRISVFPISAPDNCKRNSKRLSSPIFACACTHSSI